jgi:hypothetical protein
MNDCKNFLVRSLFRIKNNQGGGTPYHLDNSFDNYQQMQELSIKSFQKNLLGTWELIELGGEFETIQLTWLEIIKQIQQLWHDQYPCNILWTDTDTLCIKPLDIFGRFKEFRLFTEQDPLDRSQYNNACVKYYPWTLESEFWTQMQQELDNWDFTKYDTEQLVHTKLMWNQPSLHANISQKQSLIVSQLGHRFDWQVEKFDFEDISQQDLDCCVLHFHSSRGPGARLEWMQKTCKGLNILEDIV